MSSVTGSRTYIDKTRARFIKLCRARDSGKYMTPERIWDVWKVQRATWSHEYWLLKLELTEIRRMHDRQQNQTYAWPLDSRLR